MESVDDIKKGGEFSAEQRQVVEEAAQGTAGNAKECAHIVSNHFYRSYNEQLTTDLQLFAQQECHPETYQRLGEDAGRLWQSGKREGMFQTALCSIALIVAAMISIEIAKGPKYLHLCAVPVATMTGLLISKKGHAV